MTLANGILDSAALQDLGAAISDQAQSQTAAFLKKLANNIGNVNLTFVSDSSAGSAQTGSWGPRLIAALAARYPAYTVLRREWNTTNLNYDAAVTVQTGTGSNTLTVYLGAAPGQTIQYAMTNWTAMVPAMPDLFILNFGYNQSEVTSPNPPSFPGYRALYLGLIKRARQYAPRAGVLVVAQPPKKVAGIVDATARDRHLTLQLAVAELAGTETCGLIDACTAFRQTANYESLLISSDGIHPTVAGYDVWFAAALACFPSTSKGSPAAPARSLDTIILPAAAFGVVAGTVGDSYAGEDQWYNRYGHVKTFGDAAVASVATWYPIPDHWEQFNLSLIWSAASATSGNVAWNVMGKMLDLAAAAEAGNRQIAGLVDTSSYLPGGNFFAAAPATRGLVETVIVSGYTIPQNVSRLLNFSVRRIGDNAGDTMTGNAELHAVILKRAA